ncbi:hypothetical protein LTR08_005916 [Meristemomyces frigidus]|nr:hypothetical protein LTR08_005916 [Meristemomyces frigidus]
MAAILKDVRCKVADGIKIGGKPIEVIVGEGLSNKQSFYVHEAVLRQSSSFFNTALNKEWKEGQEHAVELPDYDACVFEQYVQWLYTARIACMPANNEQSNYGFGRLTRLYVLGEKLMDPALQTDIINALVLARRSDAIPINRNVNTIYEGTPVGSPARKLMVDMHVLRQGKNQLKLIAPHPDFLLDLVTSLLHKRTLSDEVRLEFAELDTGVPASYYPKAIAKAKGVVSDGV